ncbi:uncharacterized protein EDB91DRAFT_1087644 [Suillus paluster]|uniref:uncharacterized protein n=1 Tax=Suillus paluster TaxID=48578 RepID=UPI001B86A0F0|nr:uncharacterized protein EDB91DRAFT_1087644 [Suillus paluster]KAG1723990.1 hypothetical protein EDB91DRAFT_1087644 [Suillus paluster]
MSKNASGDKKLTCELAEEMVAQLMVLERQAVEEEAEAARQRVEEEWRMQEEMEKRWQAELWQKVAENCCVLQEVTSVSAVGTPSMAPVGKVPTDCQWCFASRAECTWGKVVDGKHSTCDSCSTKKKQCDPMGESGVVPQGKKRGTMPGEDKEEYQYDNQALVQVANNIVLELSRTNAFLEWSILMLEQSVKGSGSCRGDFGAESAEEAVGLDMEIQEIAALRAAGEVVYCLQKAEENEVAGIIALVLTVIGAP